MKQGRLVPLVGLGAALSALLWMAIPMLNSRTPETTWKFGPDRQEVEPYGKVPMFDAASLHVDLPFRSYVYVATFNQQDGLRALFPSDYLKSDLQNPLPPGRHRLPGTAPYKGKPKTLTWTVPNVQDSPVAYMTIISEEPIEDLQTALQRCFQIGNNAFPDLSFGSYMPKGGKKVLPKRHQLPHPLLEDLLHDPRAAMPGPMRQLPGPTRVFVKLMPLLTIKPRPGYQASASPYQKQLDQLKAQLKSKQAAPAAPGK